MNPDQPRWRYLAQESVIFLLLSYTLLLGGTLNGLVRYDLNRINALLIAALGGLWLLWRHIRGRPFPSTPVDIPLLGLACIFIVATAFSVDPRRSAGATCLLVLVIVTFYLLVDLLRAGWRSELFVKSLLIASGFIIFFGVWELVRWWGEWIAIGGLSHPLPPATIRLRAFLGHPNFAAAFLNLVLPLGLAWAARSKSFFWRAVLGFWTAVVLLLIFFTSSRGGWLGTAAALGGFLALAAVERGARMSRLWQQARRRWAVLPVSAVALAVVLVTLTRMLSVQAVHPTHGTGFGARSGIWSVALRAFLEDPLTGSGPFTYGTKFIETYSFPPDMLLAHAHSLPLNLLGETGLLGLAAFLMVLLALVKAGVSRWRSAAQGERWILIGAIASLTGLGTHSLFDLPQSLPAISLIAALLAAILVSEPGSKSHPAHNVVGNLALVAGWILVAGSLWWSLRAYAPFSRGVLAANLGKWGEAAPLMDRAARLDPYLAFYHMQAGYAHGRLALEETGRIRDAEEMASAIAYYERGLAMEPSYATNWANLGVLRWVAGDWEGAVAALTSAAERAPGEPAFQVTLGRMYEAQGWLGDAREAYQMALEKRSEWADTYFFRATSLRREVIQIWEDQRRQANTLELDPLVDGWRALEDGDPGEASVYFESSLGLNTPEAYLGLGFARFALGDLGGADKAFRTAEFAASGDQVALLRAKLALGTLEADRGEFQEAISHLESALAIVEGTTSMGLGTLGLSDYGWYIFNRESIAPDLLPGVEYLRYTDEVVGGMVQLGDCYRALGREDEALRMYRWAVQVAPDWQMVWQRLDEADHQRGEKR